MAVFALKAVGSGTARVGLSWAGGLVGQFWIFVPAAISGRQLATPSYCTASDRMPNK